MKKANRLGVYFVDGVRYRAGRRVWTAKDDAQLRALYPDLPTADVAKRLERTTHAINARADKLGLHKSAAYLASPAACRLRRGDQVGKAHRYPNGHVPANKGLRRPGYSVGRGRMQETQFKKGQRSGVAVKLWKPIGTERISKDGYLERKVNNDLPLQARWRAVHLIVWEASNGPLPKSHAVCFKNRDKTDIRLENLELITRRELMARNTVHNLPKPITSAIQLLGQLKRQIRRKTDAQEHRRSA